MKLPHKTIDFTDDQINKIGNTIIYLSQHMSDLSKTKILKILFLLEESSIKKNKTPFFGIDFQIWQHGPVAKDIYIDLSDDEPTLLADFIGKKGDVFVGVREFNDDEFSDNDIEVLDHVTTFAMSKTANELVRITHDSNSLWNICAQANNVYDLLEAKKLNSTEYTIDFSLLFSDEGSRKLYEEIAETQEFIRNLKR
ncbi:Panacea domain-containing protein [Taibaiella soli]|nr:Panacea domain-containing protein [Taibaiella soli]